MDIKAVQERLKQLEGGSSSENKTKIDYSVYWRPTEEGDYTIRILPNKKDPKYPFEDVELYWNLKNKPISPKAWGEEDIVEDYRIKLFKKGTDEAKKIAKNLFPSNKSYAQIIVRGEEDNGVRILELGFNQVKALLKYATNPEYGDFTDEVNGYDFTVTATRKEGNKTLTLSFVPARNNSPISSDKKLVKKWLTEQPDVLEHLWKPDESYLKKILKEYIQKFGESMDADTESDNSELVPKKSKYSLNTSSKAKEEKFNSVFEGEDEDSSSDSDDDDLPF